MCGAGAFIQSQTPGHAPVLIVMIAAAILGDSFGFLLGVKTGPKRQGGGKAP